MNTSKRTPGFRIPPARRNIPRDEFHTSVQRATEAAGRALAEEERKRKEMRQKLHQLHARMRSGELKEHEAREAARRIACEYFAASTLSRMQEEQRYPQLILMGDVIARFFALKEDRPTTEFLLREWFW